MSSRLPGITRPAMPRLGWLRYLLVAVALVVALLVLSPFSAVPNGHRGIKLTFGKADDAPLSEGLHLRIPIMQTIYKMPVMIERSETESEAASRDLQRVTTQVVLNYHIDPAQVVRVYRQLGVFENIEPRIIDPSVQEAMKAVTATYTAEQLVTKRPDVANAIKSALRERMQRHGLVIDEFSITNFKFSDSFDAAIEAKTVAEQRIAQARAEAESTKLGAQAQAEALRMQRESITPELIRLREVEARIKAIEKWDGKMPQVSGGAVPFINVQPEAR